MAAPKKLVQPTLFAFQAVREASDLPVRFHGRAAKFRRARVREEAE
jgi:hypothetical protein